MSALTLLKALAVVLPLAGCISTPQLADPKSAIAEVNSRTNHFPSYPQAGVTYLSFDLAHGFQINYIGNSGKAWLWYPGNRVVLTEEYKKDRIREQNAICWRSTEVSFNSVTGTRGDQFACESLDFAQRTTIASLSGDVFNLQSGNVPYTLDRCSAPNEFQFDRQRYSC